MNYLIHDGELTLPGCDVIIDESINILKLPQLQASLVISRARLPEGMTTEAYLSGQLAKLKQDTRHFLCGDPVPAQLGDMPAMELSCSFEKQNMKVYQQLLCTQQMPALLVLSFTRPAPPDEAAMQWWQQVKARFVARQG